VRAYMCVGGGGGKTVMYMSAYNIVLLCECILASMRARSHARARARVCVRVCTRVRMNIHVFVTGLQIRCPANSEYLRTEYVPPYSCERSCS
jgi:hypothetical protein